MAITFEAVRGAIGRRIAVDRFKTNRISVNFVMPLDPATVSAFALLPFVLTRSCRKYPTPTALNAKLASLYGANLFADSVKSGDAQVLRIVVSALDDRYADAPVTSECAELLSEIIFRPLTDENGLFRAVDIEREKRLLIERIESEINDKRTYALARCEELTGAGTPFGTPKYGTAEQAAALTPADVTRALREVLTKAQVRIHAVGGGDFSQIFDGLGAKFAEIDRNPVSLDCPPAAAATAERASEALKITQGKLVMAFTSELPENAEETAALQVAADLFGGGPYSKLFLNVREKLSLCYYCAARYNRRKGLVTVDSGVEFANMQKAEEEILRQLAAVQNGDFTEKDLAASKAALTDSLGTVSDSPAALDEWYTRRIFDENPESPEETAAKISAVSAEDVRKAAARLKLRTVFTLTGSEAPETEGRDSHA